LPALVAATPVGETVAVEVVRHGETRTLEVTVAELADEEPVPAEPAEQKGKWGLAVRELRPEDRERRGITGREGVLVAGVAPASPADEAGIQPGDVILQVNQTPVASVAALRREVDHASGDRPLLLLLRRPDGSSRFAALTAG
jgi:serine protease Do